MAAAAHGPVAAAAATARVAARVPWRRAAPRSHAGMDAQRLPYDGLPYCVDVDLGLYALVVLTRA